MKNEGFERGACEIWIDHLKQIVSFREEEGFEVLAFSTPENGLHTLLKNVQTVTAFSKQWLS